MDHQERVRQLPEEHLRLHRMQRRAISRPPPSLELAAERGQRVNRPAANRLLPRRWRQVVAGNQLGRRELGWQRTAQRFHGLEERRGARRRSSHGGRRR